MRVRDSGTDLVVDDHSTLDRWIGALNFVIAGGCAAFALTQYRPGGEWRDIFLLLIVPFAVAISMIGLWRAVGRPATVLHVDGVQRVVTLSRRTTLRRVADHWPAEQVVRFARAQRPGQDGALIYRLRLDLADGRSMPAATLWLADPAPVDAVVARANALLDK